MSACFIFGTISGSTKKDGRNALSFHHFINNPTGLFQNSEIITELFFPHKIKKSKLRFTLYLFFADERVDFLIFVFQKCVKSLVGYEVSKWKSGGSRDASRLMAAADPTG